MDTYSIVACCVGIVGAITGIYGVIVSSESNKQNKSQIETFKNNCISTLESNVKNMNEDIKILRENQAKLFDSEKNIIDRLSGLEGYVEGQRNGSK